MFKPEEHFINLKGKDYLQVAWRLVWFREDHPDWTIDTQMISADNEGAIFRCVITDKDGKQIASAHGSETKRDFGDYLEKAETKAVGRCLCYIGYGTQFAGEELDEGERIVDSPVEKKKKKPVVGEKTARVNAALEGTGLNLTIVNEWIKKKFGATIPIESLDEDKMQTLIESLANARAKKIESEEKENDERP